MTTPPSTSAVDIPALVKKAESGEATAQFQLGQCCANGDGVSQAVVHAVGWCHKAADQDHAEVKGRIEKRYYWRRFPKTKPLPSVGSVNGWISNPSCRQTQ